MKKKLIFILSSFLFFTLILVNFIPTNIKAKENPTVEALGATYTATTNIIDKEIGYGIHHIKDFGVSSATNLNNYDSCGPKDVLVGQQVNVLSIPSNEAVRIVNWTYLNQSGWTKQTVRKLAENFEYHNPGWKVMAAINGDFFDINGNAALPFHGNGYVVSNGNVLKPFGSASAVGFKNDGSGYQLVGGQKIEAGPLKLQVVDTNDNVIKEFDVNKINADVNNGEVGVWFTYNVMENSVRNEVPVTVHGDNIYFCENPVRCLPMSQTTIYAKGKLNHFTDEKTLRLGQFAIETTNTEITSLIDDGAIIRLQQNIVGAYADCDNITGAGIQLVKDGVAVGDSDINRHPRTCVGIKADGSVVFFTVDGRQFDTNMYGMSGPEMAAALMYYGCVEAYNLDGGGSTTVITRNQYGDFDVHNSPSDGGERSDSNALLVVVPEVSIDVTNVTDTNITINYTSNPEVKATNINLTIGEERKTLNQNNYVWDNLKPLTSYELHYTYDIAYKSSILKGEHNTIYFTTGKDSPKFKSFYYEETENEYLIHFALEDSGKTLTSPRIKYSINGSSKSISISPNSGTTVSIEKVEGLDPSTFTFSGRYNLASSSGEVVKFDIPIYQFASHSISYDLDGGIQNSENIESYDSTSLPVILKEPSKENYYFMGWYDENGNRILNISNTDKGNMKLYAKWQEKAYKFTVNIDGEETTEFYYYNDLISKPANPVKEGYEFTGWDKTIPDNMPKENITLNATWKIKSYKLKINIDGNITEVVYNYKDPITTPENPTKEGYQFIGWDGELPTNMPSHDIMISAVWEKIEVPVEDEGGCGSNAALFISLTSVLSLAIVLIRRKH